MSVCFKMNIYPAKVAEQRLAQKEAEVKKQLNQTKELVATVTEAKSLLHSFYERQCKYLQGQLDDLRNALLKKEQVLRHELEVELKAASRLNDKLIIAAESCIESTKIVLQEAKDVHHQENKDIKFIKKCTSVSQSLEDQFMTMLLLFSDHDVNIAQRKELPIDKALQAIEYLQFTDEMCDNEVEPPRSIQDLPATGEFFADVGIAEDSVLNKEGKPTDFISQSSFTEVPVLNALPPTPYKSALEYLSLAEEVEMDVVVTGVKDPHNFCVQPCGDQLVELMERMGNFYGDLAYDDECQEVVNTFQIGDYCCAQFTQDDCWYRAVITAVGQSHNTQGNHVESDTSVHVKYVDYGNEEWVTLSRLQPLDPSFLDLPCQALSCFVAGITSSGFLLTDSDVSGRIAQKAWSPQLALWLESLLLGKVVRIVIKARESPDRYGVDILIPCEWLLSQESLANFPVPVQCTINMNLVLKPGSVIKLSALLCISGIAFPLQPDHFCESSTTNCFHSASSFVTDVFCIPPHQNVEALPASSTLIVTCDDQLSSQGPQSAAEESVSVNTSEVNVQSESDGQLSTASLLKPLSLLLGPASDFAFLVSYVKSSREFYVHPIQKDIAESILMITESLVKHYSVLSNQHHLPRSSLNPSLHCGTNRVLCCVQCLDDKQWYRGVISTPVLDGDKCSVQLIDFGECLEVSVEDILELAEEFCDLPAQAVCCSLVCSADLPEDSSTSYAPHSDNIVCDFLQDSIMSRQLVACVKVEGSSNVSQFSVNYGSVVVVDVMDTSGEKDVPISQLLQEMSPDMLCTTSEAGEVSNKLNEWNPMIRDYLGPKNNYTIDDESAGLALHGYESTHRLCRFYKSEAGCYNGDECPYLHLKEGVYDKQLEEVHTANEQLELPVINSVVVVVVTAIVSATRFYVQLPLGTKSAFNNYVKEKEADSALVSEMFLKLLQEMRTHYDRHVFSERTVISPEIGEIVAVRYSNDNQWYRARVVGIANPGKIKVFYVDYGHCGLVSEENLRNIKPEFLFVPYQAVECCLPGLYFPDFTIDSDKAEAKQYFESLVSGHVVVAKVVTRSPSGVLGLELYSDVYINKQLVAKGYLFSKGSKSTSL